MRGIFRLLEIMLNLFMYRFWFFRLLETVLRLRFSRLSRLFRHLEFALFGLSWSQFTQ